MFTVKMKKVGFNVESSKWEDFKIIAKINQSDSNKELRKFIDKYLSKNKQQVIKTRDTKGKKDGE